MRALAGYVLYNGFWNREAPDPARRLQQAGARLGVALRPVPNTAFVTEFPGDSAGIPSAGVPSANALSAGTPSAGAPSADATSAGAPSANAPSANGSPAPRVRVTGPDGPLTAADFVLCWDKDVRLLRAMEACGVRVYNTADSVALCDDKAATHRVLAGAGLPMPRTFVAPMTYVSYDNAGDGFLQTAATALGFPLVVKECFGSLGEQVYLARDEGELFALAHRMGHRPFLLQQFIRPAGEDYRLYVVGGRVAAAMRRRSPHDFRANIGAGGHGERYTPTPDEEALACRCCEALGLGFGGVDLLHGPHGRPLVCEVNASAHMAALTACTGVDVAAGIVAYVRSRETAR